MRKRIPFDIGWLVAAALPLVGLLPALIGVPGTADGPLHIHRIQAATHGFQAGYLWPRWIPYFHLGYGYPIFNFYPPGVFFAGGLLGLLGVQALHAFTLIAAAAWSLGSAGTYGLARSFLPAPAALIAAMVWAYAPSRLYEVWDQGSLPQMMAAAFLPWLLWAMLQAAFRPSYKRAVLVALFWAGVIFCHLPITLIAALYVAPAALILPAFAVWRAGELRQLGHIRAWRVWGKRIGAVWGGLILGGMVSAIFALPMAFELRYIDASQGREDNVNELMGNFLSPADVFLQPPAPDQTDLYSKLPTTLGLVGGIMAAIGAAGLLFRRRYAAALILLAGLGFTVFMLIEASAPLWLNIPFFRQLRYPERFLRMGAVFVALLAGAAWVWALPPRRFRTPAWAGRVGYVALLFLPLIAALPLTYPKRAYLQDSQWGTLTAVDEILFELETRIWGTTTYNEFNPIWGASIPFNVREDLPELERYATNPFRIVVHRVDMARSVQAEETSDNTAVVTLTEPRRVRFRQFYFPGWVGTVDGQPASLIPDDEYGLIALDLPAGRHTITLSYTGTVLQHLSAALSLIGLGTCIALFALRLPDAPPQPAPSRTPILAGIALTALIAALAAFNTVVIGPSTLLFRTASPPDSPAAMWAALRTTFTAADGEQVELLGYSLLSGNRAAAGGNYTLQLFWRVPRPVKGDYRPIVQLTNLTGSQAWAVSEPFFPGAGPTTTFTPDKFSSDTHKLRLFGFAPPYAARITVQLVVGATGEPLKLPDGGTRLTLPETIAIEGPSPAVNQTLSYVLGGAVALRCVSVTPADDGYDVALYWGVNAPLPADYTVMLHGLESLESGGALVSQADGPPLGQQFPTSLWRPGQTLKDVHHLPAAPGLSQLAIGLYTAEGRAAVTLNGQPVPDNRIVLTLADLQGKSCER